MFSRPCDGFADPVEDQTEIAQHKLIREAQNREALALQPGIPFRIAEAAGLGLVRLAVQLDNQACGGTEEVGDVRRNRNLPPEFQPMEAPGAHLLPDGVFGLCVGLPLLLGEGAQARIGFSVTPVVPKCP